MVNRLYLSRGFKAIKWKSILSLLFSWLRFREMANTEKYELSAYLLIALFFICVDIFRDDMIKKCMNNKQSEKMCDWKVSRYFSIVSLLQ